jgi:hypothetical protein
MSLLIEWLPTGKATNALGVSADTLKRYALKEFFLVEGKHYRRGPHHNSPYVWHIPSCIDALTYRGRLRGLST